MKLYYSRGSCSLAPHIIAREALVKLSLQAVDPRTKITANKEDFRVVNPKGYVPALVLDDGHVLTEMSPVLQYLADRNPQAHLIPAAGTLARYRAQEWLHFISTEIHKPWSSLFPVEAKSDAWLTGVRQKSRDLLQKRLEYAARNLRTRPYLMGEFGVADAYLFSLLRWARMTRVELDPVLSGFKKRVSERPGVKEALQAEGLTKRV